MKFKRGDTFDASGTMDVLENGAPVASFVGWTGRCQVRSLTGALVDTLTFSWLDASAGLFRVLSDDTTHWKTGSLSIDIELVTPAGDVISTETAEFQCLPDVTRVA